MYYPAICFGIIIGLLTRLIIRILSYTTINVIKLMYIAYILYNSNYSY